MRNEDFVNHLDSKFKEFVRSSLKGVQESFNAIESLKKDTDWLLDQEHPYDNEMDKRIADSSAMLYDASYHVDAYRMARQRQQAFAEVVGDLKKIDFSKIPIKYFKGVSQSYDNVWGTASLGNVSYASIDSFKGFSLTLNPENQTAIVEGLYGGFDTKDPYVTDVLNRAGFYSFDQVQKLIDLEKMFKDNSAPYRGYISTILGHDGPCTLLEYEFKAIAALGLDRGWEIVKDFFYEYQDKLPVPLDWTIVKKLQKNNFMEPIKISLEKFDDPLISKRAVIGDCLIDFYRKFPGDDRTLGAELLIPKEKLTVQQEKEMRSSRHFDEPFDAPKYFTRELSREVAKFGSDTNNKSLFFTLYGPDGDKMIRDFIASPEMLKTLSEIPTHCLIQDTYRPKPQKIKQAQR